MSATGIPEFMKATGLHPLQVETFAQGIFHIHGELCQVVHILLQPNQKIQCEPGTMCYASDQCKAEIKVGGIGRLITEGDLFKSVYHNTASTPGYVGVTPNFPATIIPVNLDRVGGTIMCKHDSFLAAIDHHCNVSMSSLSAASVLGCCCSGLPFFMQRVEAKGWIFLAAHGTIMEKTLAEGEELIVDTNSVVAVSPTVTVDVRRTGGCSVICCGDEGLFNTALKGPGHVYLSSMPMEKLRRLFPRPKPKPKKKPVKK